MVSKFKKLITKINFSKLKGKKNAWLVIHYVGAVSTAENNAKYFYEVNRQASAHYFVDEHEIWQVVEDEDCAWHVGGAKVYYNGCRNNNSIGIEMCCKKNSKGQWFIEPETIENTLAIACILCKKYKIDMNHVVRHFDVTRKNLS